MSNIRKTRILYVNHTGRVSGAEKVLLNIVRCLDNASYKPYVLCPTDGELIGQVRALGVECFPLSTIRARFSWRPDLLLQSLVTLWMALSEMRKSIRALAPDLVHANSIRSGVVASLAAIGTRKPVIWHVHDTLPSHSMSNVIRLLAYLIRGTRVITVSRSTEEAFRGSFSFGERVRTIYNGVDFSRFPHKGTGNSAFREEIGISERDFLVCAVGQICARKGLLELIDALWAIHTEAQHIHLAIVGKVVFPHEAGYLDVLHVAVKEAGLEACVHFTGERDDVPPVLQSADLLVLNSTDEPFGLVLIEAMACGTPILATRVGGVPEIVTDSESGWLIDSGDTASLSQKLLILSQDRSSLLRVAQTAYYTTCPKFSLQQFQRELVGFYAELDPNAGFDWNVRNRPTLARSVNNQGA